MTQAGLPPALAILASQAAQIEAVCYLLGLAKLARAQMLMFGVAKYYVKVSISTCINRDTNTGAQ